MKNRNAYAQIARARKNAGPMVHKDPPREKVKIYYCKLCREEVVEDADEICEDCWFLMMCGEDE
jgi:hypothetical protein